MCDYTEKECLCALNKILGYEPLLSRDKIRQYGSAQAIFAAKGVEGVGEDALRWAREELRRIAALGGRFVALGEEDYPSLLAECADPPLGLYFRSGSTPTEVFAFRRAVAIVGTRDLSPYGRVWCERLVTALSEAAQPPLIVSGLAYGADALAHRTALRLGLPTVAVIPTGIDSVYPWRHQDLAGEILSTPGCALVTDYPSATAPVPLNFIRRNRIIAGLSEAVIVIESKRKGGSLITAKYANEYNRDVFALPGRIDDIRSAGCNSLIRTKMADIITDPDALVERLGLRKAAGSSRKENLLQRVQRRYGPTSFPTRLVHLVCAHKGATVEELSRLSGAPYTSVLESVVLLESVGVLTTDLMQRCYLGAWG